MNGSGAAALLRGVAPLQTAGRLRRHRLDEAGWRQLVDELRDDPLALVGLWAEGDEIHALFLDAASQPLIGSVAVERGRYLALSPVRPAASLAERIIRDLWGHEAMAALDLRPWLDHGAWGLTAPRAVRPGPPSYPPEPIEFLPVPDRGRRGGALRIDGPVRREGAPWISATSLTSGSVLAFEPRLGCAHRGAESRLVGRPVGAAVRLAARIDAGASVAHALALARAIEDAAGFVETQAPELAERRRVLLELERLAGHLRVLAALAAACGERGLASELGEAGEQVRACCAEGWDHRLLFDTVSPADAAPVMPGLAAIADLWRADWAPIARRFDAALARKLAGLAVLPPALASAYGILGLAGRASGQGFDARRLGGRQLGAELSSGDALARARLRLAEIGVSLEALVPQLKGQSSLPLKPAFASVSGEGLGVAEAANGPVWAWVRLEAGLVAAVWFDDPSLPVFGVLPQLMSGMAPVTVPVALASLGLSVTGTDG